ncbi:MAG: hypothetical protein K2O04_00510 [Clostridiales bacterium]|nr:hypothetical protein [Clostridiales bacterium]
MAKKDKTKPEKPTKEKPVKDKKGKDKKDAKGAAAGAVPPAAGMPPTGAASNGVPSTGMPSVPLANLSPDQMTQAQIEQAIKESNDPNNKLKKLRSPINLRSCLLNVLILIVATLAVVILWCFFVVDKFNFGLIMSDMFGKFGITEFFTNLGSTISGWFGG